MPEEAKAVVTVSEMARMVGLSRARFYQLQKAGVFPMPVYDSVSGRPVYIQELQQVCLEVRRRSYGVNGQPVVFYARRARPRMPAGVAEVGMRLGSEGRVGHGRGRGAPCTNQTAVNTQRSA